MKKKIISLFMVLTFILSLTISSNAAYFSDSSNSITANRVPTSISYEDFRRLEEVATEVSGRSATVVNATQYFGSNLTWAVRLAFDSEGRDCADYIVTVVPYTEVLETKQVTSLPFKNVAEGTEMYGPNWYYFGLFDSDTHVICGYGIAERVKRWPAMTDLSFSGTTARGVNYNGSYPSNCTFGFIESHILIK